jgi:DNA-binding response OmpR family regulator
VVDDDPAARKAIIQILRICGFSVLQAPTVAEGLTLLAERPDWVLLDLMLPDGCGIEILKRIRSENLALRVCVISGCGPSRLEEVKAYHPQLVLNKPVDVTRLIATLAA